MTLSSRSALAALTLALTLGAGTVAVAQTAAPAAPEAPSEPPPGIAGGHGQARFISSHDADGDGQVTREEFEKVRLDRFTGADKDGDDFLNEEEYVTEYETRLKQNYMELNREPDEFYERSIKQAHVRFAIVDRDRDGRYSRDEDFAVADGSFIRLDTNKDNVVSIGDPEPKREQPAENSGSTSTN